jgi:hypothetical protein
MRFLSTLILLALLPLATLAESRLHAPLVAVGDGSVLTRQKLTQAAPTSLPEETTIPEKTTSPPRPERPSSPPRPESPPRPASPPSPESPERPTKLWPRDTIPIFVTACSHLNADKMPPCRCIINGLMTQMMHDEFLRLSQAHLIETDTRYITLRENCVAQAKHSKP